MGYSTIASLLFVANFYFMYEIDYFAAPDDSYPLLHLWSLGVEEQFYIVLPVIFLVLWRFGKSGIISGLAVLSALSLMVAVAMMELYPKGAFYMLPARFWEMGLGVLLGVWSPVAPRGLLGHAASLLGAALIAIPLFAYDHATPFPGLSAIPAVLGAALLIWAGPGSACGRVLSFRPLVGIGLVSYALYLWHWPLLSFYRYLSLGETTVVGLLSVLVLSFVLSVMSYFLIEKPIRSRRFIFASNRAIFGSSLAVVLMLCTVGGALIGSGGWPGRWRDTSLAVVDAGGQSPFGDRLRCRGVPAFRGQFVCGVGPEGDRIDFVVWGSSHAIASEPAFARFAANTGLTGVVIGRSACIGLLGARNVTTPVWHRCLEHNRAVMDFIVEARPRLVVLASHWEAHRTHEFVPGDKRRYWLSNQLPFLRQGDLATAVSETVNELRANGVQKVAWLRAVPNQNIDISRMLVRAAEWQRPVVAGVSRAVHMERQQEAEAVFRAMDGLIEIEHESLLCPGEECIFLMDGVPLYRDAGHLSRFGAESLVSLVQQALIETGD